MYRCEIYCQPIWVRKPAPLDTEIAIRQQILQIASSSWREFKANTVWVSDYIGEKCPLRKPRENGPGGRVGQDERNGRNRLLQRLLRLRVVLLFGCAVVFEAQRKAGERICKYQFDSAIQVIQRLPCWLKRSLINRSFMFGKGIFFFLASDEYYLGCRGLFRASEACRK